MIEYRLKEEFEAYKSDFELIREQIDFMEVKKKTISIIMMF